MQFSTHHFRNLEAKFRFDAEYYQLKYKTIDEKLRKREYKTLGQLKTSLISFGPYSLCSKIQFSDEGIPFIQSKDIINGKVTFDNIVYIDQLSHKLLWKSEVKENTLLISMAGSIGSCAIASTRWRYPINSNQAVAKLQLCNDINPKYVLVYLLSYFGQMYFERFPNGSVQDNMLLWQIDDVPVYIASQYFQSKIALLVDVSEKLIELSKQILRKAELYLLSKIGLDD